jgi:hypothetical protein
VFREQGIGWQMENGVIAARGSEAFALATHDGVATICDVGTPTAANEIHDALTDISRRPTADLTGAIQHAMAALECVAREIDGTNDTLGSIINRLKLSPPLDSALHKLWGFASKRGRHIQEGRIDTRACAHVCDSTFPTRVELVTSAFGGRRSSISSLHAFGLSGRMLSTNLRPIGSVGA